VKVREDKSAYVRSGVAPTVFTGVVWGILINFLILDGSWL